MAVKQTTVEYAYGVGDNLISLAPRPIVAERNPTTADQAQIGTPWINKSTYTVYTLAGFSSGASQWVTSPASGVGTFTSVTVNPGDIDVTAGDITIAAGNLALTAGNATVGGDLTVGGTTTLNGDVDITTTALFDITSTLDADPSIYLHADGGTSEGIKIHSDQGTSATSVQLLSDVGGISLISTAFASADAINLSAIAGGVDVDGALQVNIASSQAAADAVRLVASDAAGGIDIDCGTGGIAVDSTGAFSLQGAAASDISVSGAGIDVSIVSAAGRVIVNGEEAAANAITLLSAAGGLDANVALQMNLDSSQAAADAVRMIASDAAGGIDIDCGTGGIAIDSTGAFSLDGAAASNVSVSGAGIDLSLESAAGRVVVDAAEAAVDAVRIVASDAAGGIDVDCGTGGLAVDSTGAFSIDGAAASNVSVSGAGIDLSLESAAGRVIMNGEEAAANALTLLSAAGGLDANVALQMNLDSSQAAADAIRVIASDAAGGIDIDCGTGGIAVDSTGAFSVQGAAASDISVSGAGIDLSLVSAAGRVVINGEEAAADAITLLSAAGGLDANVALQMNLDSSQAAADAVRIIASDAAGGIDIDCGTGGIAIDSTGVFSIQGAAASDVSVSGAGIDVTVQSAAGRVVVDGGEAAADAVRITASDAAGGIDVDYGTGGMTVTGANGAYTLATGTGAVNVSADAAATTVNVGTGAAVKTVTVGSTNSTSATVIQSGTGGLSFNSGTGTRGLISMDPEVATEVAGASSTLNVNVGRVIFQGITTASGADEDITITCNKVTTTSALFVTVDTLSGGNDADLTIEGVRKAAGSFVLHCINNGPAAVNTDVTVSFWVIS